VFYSPYVFTLKTLPQVWRIFTAFLITKPKFGILLDPYFLYQYGSGLERESSRFSQPGDFFVYTAFVASVIVVSLPSRLFYVVVLFVYLVALTPRLRCACSCYQSSTSKYLPAQPTILAEAVPGIEEEYPCTSHGSRHSQNKKRGLCGVVSMVGLPFEKAYAYALPFR
jgi:Derlin-2/3